MVEHKIPGIYVPGTYTNIFFLIFRLIRYTRTYVFFFSLSGVLFTREDTIPQLNETVKQDKIREAPENRKAEGAKRPRTFFAFGQKSLFIEGRTSIGC